MLQAIRQHFSSVAPIIIGFIALTFGIFGLDAYLSDSPIPHLAEVEDVPITSALFQQRLQSERANLQEMFGGQLPIDDASLRASVLDRLIEEAVIDYLTRRNNLQVADQQLVEEIQKVSYFQENGGFSLDRYRALLSSQRYSQAAYEAEVRNSMRLGQWRNAIFNSGFVTPAQALFNRRLENESRAISYASFSVDNFSSSVTIDEPAAIKYYDENPDKYLNSARAKLAYVELSLSELASQAVISEERLRQEYQTQIDRYRQPEERRTDHIFVRTNAEFSPSEAGLLITNIKEKLENKEISFDQAIVEISKHPQGEGGDLGWLRNNNNDSPFDAALFTMNLDSPISEPVITPEGVHLLRLTDIRPEQAKPFEEVAEELRQSLQQAEADQQFQEIVERLQTLSFEQPDTLDGVIAALDLPIKTTDWVTPTSNDGVMAHRSVRSAIFSDAVIGGQNSDLLEVGEGHFVVLRVTAHEPSKRRTFDEVREEIIAALQREAAKTSAANAVTDILKQLPAQESLDWKQLVETAKGQLGNSQVVNRKTAAVAPEILTAAFRAPSPPTGQASLTQTTLANGDQILVAVHAVIPPSDETDTADATSQAQRHSQTEGNAYLAAQRNQLTVRVFPERLTN